MELEIKKEMPELEKMIRDRIEDCLSNSELVDNSIAINVINEIIDEMQELLDEIEE